MFQFQFRSINWNYIRLILTITKYGNGRSYHCSKLPVIVYICDNASAKIGKILIAMEYK